MTVAPVRELTPAQRRVAWMIAEGRDLPEIAALLAIRYDTVVGHVRTIAQLLPQEVGYGPLRTVRGWAITHRHELRPDPPDPAPPGN